MAVVTGYPTSYAIGGTSFYTKYDGENAFTDDNTYAVFRPNKNTPATVYYNGFTLGENIPSNAVINSITFESKIEIENDVNVHKIHAIREQSGSSTLQSANVDINLNCTKSNDAIVLNLPFVWTPEMLNNNTFSVGLTLSGTGSPGLFNIANRVAIYYLRIVVDYSFPPYTVKFDGNGSTSGSMSAQSIEIDKATALTANKFKKEYTVTFNGNGASNSTATSSATFQGWATSAGGAKVYNDKQSVTNIASAGGQIILYAKWSAMSAVTLPTPTRDGYTFLGWYTEASGGTKVSGSTYTPSGNVTLYAHWKIDSHTVTFDYNMDTLVLVNGVTSKGKVTQTVNHGSTITLSDVPEVTGYTFDGWYYENGTKYNSEPCESDVTLIAHWTTISYTITFENADEKTLTYTIESNDTIPNPSKEGYIFSYWSTSNNTGNWTKSTYNAGVTLNGKYGNVTLTAMWSPIPYNIIFMDGTKQIDFTIEDYDTEITITGIYVLAKEGYTFLGWATAEEPNKVYKPGDSFTVKGDITLYAVWEQESGLNNIYVGTSKTKAYIGTKEVKVYVGITNIL